MTATLPSARTPPRTRLLPCLAAGAALGLTWGIAARLWMRYVSDDPQFTWSGTLFILGLATWLGLLLGLVEAMRRRGRSRWWRLAALPGLLLFAGPGMVLLPAALFGGMAAGRPGPRWLRLVAGVLALAPVAFLLVIEHDLPHSTALSAAGLLVLCLGLALGGSVVFRPVTGQQAGPG